MRTLGKTLVHLQNSMDRACLEMEYGALWKHAKMSHGLYPNVEFLVQEPREGGYVLDFLTDNPLTRKIIDRVSGAINGAVQQSMEAGLDNSENIAGSMITRKMQVEHELVKPETFQSLFTNPDPNIVRRYGDRAIVREIDQILSILRSKISGDSGFDLSLYGNNSATYEFNRSKANKFHSTIAKKQLGQAIIYSGVMKSLSWTTLKGEFVNTNTGKSAILSFVEPSDFQEVFPYFEEKTEFTFIGCPLIEYGAFDPMAGDIYYLRLV